MIIDGENIIISIEMNKEEVIEFYHFIKDRLEYIETITVETEGNLGTSMLLQLLASIKKTNNNIRITLFEGATLALNKDTTMNWVFQ